MADEGFDGASLRRFATGFGGAVVGVAVALFAYFQFVAPDVERDAEEVAASQVTPAPMPEPPVAAASAPAPEPAPDAAPPPAPDAVPPPEPAAAPAANTALDSVADGIQSATASIAALAGGRERAAREALNRAAGYRTAVSEVYVSSGAWPASTEATGMPSLDPSTSGAVQSIDVGPGGVITVRLRAPFAAGSRFVLTPTAGTDYSIQWNCRSEGDAALHAAVPEC